MAVQRTKSGSRMLVVLEQVARHQPVALADLHRHIGGDKSGIQRSLMTLADGGWIAVAPGTASQWQLTSHIHVVAKYARDNDDMRRTAMPVMRKLRDECDETVFLAVSDASCFVIIDVAESRKVLRIAPKIGLVIPAQNSTTARIILPYLSTEQQIEYLGRAPDEMELEAFEFTRQRGYAVYVQEFAHTQDGKEPIGSTTIGAPIFDHYGIASAALAISGPSERVPTESHEELGRLALKAAREISRGEPK